MPIAPPLPDLRRQVMARLIELKQTNPAATLADAQSAVARDHGFESWSDLQASKPRPTRRIGPHTPRRREDLTATRFRFDALDDDGDIRAQQAFFRRGMLAQAGFLVAALAGLWLLFAKTAPEGGWNALIRLARALSF